MRAFAKKSGTTTNLASSNKGHEDFFGVQAKLNIGKADDKYEREADYTADKVVQQSESLSLIENNAPLFSPSIQRQETNEQEVQQKPIVDSISQVTQLKPEEDVQEKEDKDIQEKEEEKSQSLQMSGGDDNPSLKSDLNHSKGGGSPLSNSIKNEMESGFGADFSEVSIHNDSKAVQMNKELGSQAFTNGNDIYFNEGKYNPDTHTGKHLLAHELTHTVQQGAAHTSNTVQKSEEPNNPTVGAPTQAVDITNRLQLTDDWLAYIEESRRQHFDIKVKIGTQFEGTIKIRKRRRPAEGEPQKFELSNSRRNNTLNVIGMDFLNPLKNAGVYPVLVLNSFGEEQTTTGFLSIRTGERVVPNVLGIIQGINDHLEEMSFLGLSPIEVAEGLENRFENGGLQFRANNLSTNIDGYIEATGSLGITDSNLSFELNSTVDIAGLASGEFNVARGADGKLSGQANISADIANINASLTVEYDDGAVTIQGTGRMNSDKFSGAITLLVTDSARSRQIMHAALGVETMEQEAEVPAQERAAVSKTKDNQVLAGWGEVQATITPWLEGTAKIGIDNEGHVTIVGEIVVPDEIELMEQRGKKVDLFDVEIRAGYGIPLVGQVFLFASVGMFVNTGFGPLVLKNVGFTGTYSTDPSVLQEFSITGTLGINAFAVLGLEAEAGVGVTLIGHDVKAGVNVTAAAGLRAYAEATPTFEYKEEATPEGGKVGESRLKGHFEAAAQLFLQLSGALFYELDSPWWSPAPDGREEFPLGEVQYPIGDSLGIGADVDWLVGGEEPPELTLSPVEFDPDKFTADVMADPPPRTMGDSESSPEGEWEDENANNNQSENPEVTGEGEGLPPNGNREEDLSNLSDQQKYMRALDELSQLENTNPKPIIGAVEDKIRTVKRRYGIGRIQIRNEETESVAIYVEHGEENNSRHLLEIPLMSEAEKRRLIDEGLRALHQKEREKAENGVITRANAEAVAREVESEFQVFISVRITDGEDSWDYIINYGNESRTEVGRTKSNNSEEQDTEQSGINTSSEVESILGMSKSINTDGGHTLKIEGTLERVEINVYSEKQTLNSLLNDKRQEIHNNRESDSEYEAKSRAIERLFSEKRVLGTKIGAYKRAVDNAYSPGGGNEPIRNVYNLIVTSLTNIAADLVIVGVLKHTIELPVSRVSFETDSKGRAYMLRAAPLSKIPGNTRGSTPTQNPQGWINIPVSLRRSGAWVRAHMLNHRLHGPGTRENLFPGTRDINLRDMENQVEQYAKEAVWDNSQVIYYNVDVSYGNTGMFEDIPTVITMRYGPFNTETNTLESPAINKRFTQNPPTIIEKVTVNGSSSGTLNSKAKAEGGNNGTGLSGFFDRLVRGRPEGGYQNIVQVRSIVSDLYNNQDAFMSAFVKFNNLIITNVLEYD
ncbi:eCIS core domain-containing protein [Sinomicrobium sp. M5D2P9]